MRHHFTLAILAVLGLGIAGCATNQSQTQRYRDLYQQAQSQIEDLRGRLEEARSRASALQEKAAATPELVERLEQAVAERDRLLEALSDAESQLRELAAARPLPKQLDEAVMELAERYPDLMSYNPDRGMIRLHSDLTFGLGSVELSEEATRSLQRLAEILKASYASDYEVRVVGHTDNVPIRRPATREKHPTNWHLSVHRAISVMNALKEAGVSERRIGVAGYGSHRPSVPHRTGPDGQPTGTEANRRVELLLVPMLETELEKTRGDGGAASPDEDASPRATSRPEPEPEPEPEPDGAFK